jgi:nitrate/nitrite transporter NarK
MAVEFVAFYTYPFFCNLPCVHYYHKLLSLHLTKSNTWLTNIYSMVGGIPVGLVLGPLCDQYGTCILITLMLVGGAIPCLCTGLVTNVHR